MSQYTKYPPQSGGGGSGITSINSQVGPALVVTGGTGISVASGANTITITNTAPLTVGTPNTFAGFDAVGSLESIPGFSINTTSGGMDESLTIQPDNNGSLNINSSSLSTDPLQNSPNECYNLHYNYINLDINNSGFNQGINGTAITAIGNFINHQGTGDLGRFAFISNSFSIGNGTDPITVGGLSYSYGFGNINANVTLDGSLQGYGFQPNIDSSVVTTSNTSVNAFYDSPNIPVTLHGYNAYSSFPIISGIANNSSYIGLGINPQISTFTGNAGFQAISSFPTLTTLGATSYVAGLNFSPTIITMTSSSSLQGAYLGANVTTSHGNITGLSINHNVTGGDATYTGISINPYGGATLTDTKGIYINLSALNSTDTQGKIGIDSDSRVQVNASTQLNSGEVFQIGSRIEHLFTVPNGSPVTGTDEIAVNIAGDFLVQDDVANGTFGLGFVGTSAISTVAVANTKTVDSMTAFLVSGSLPDPGFATGGSATDFHLVRIFPPTPQGGTLNITNLYGLHIDSSFGLFSAQATNTWGLFIEDPDLNNFIEGKIGVGILSPTAKLHLQGSTASPSSAPLKIDSGTLMTTPENGAIESNGTHLYWTNNSGVRQQLDGGGGSSLTPKKETFVLTGTDITNQYIDLTQVAQTDSILFLILGLQSAIEGASYDYTVSYTGGAGGKTRITFLNGIATGGVSALVAGDVIQINYIY